MPAQLITVGGDSVASNLRGLTITVTANGATAARNCITSDGKLFDSELRGAP